MIKHEKSYELYIKLAAYRRDRSEAQLAEEIFCELNDIDYEVFKEMMDKANGDDIKRIVDNTIVDYLFSKPRLPQITDFIIKTIRNEKCAFLEGLREGFDKGKIKPLKESRINPLP